MDRRESKNSKTRINEDAQTRRIILKNKHNDRGKKEMTML